MTASNQDRKPIEYYLNLRYPITLEPDEEGGYFASITDLPGCITEGETIDEALENLEVARTLWIETAYSFDDVIPLPTSNNKYSGKFLLRVPPYLHQKLAESAQREGVSLNQYLVSLLSGRDAVSQYRPEKMEKLFGSLLNILENPPKHPVDQDSVDKLFGSISLDSSPKKGIIKPKNI